MAAIAAGGGDDGVNPGDTVTLMTSDLFDVEPGYTASYGVSVEGDSANASASGEAITITALMAGEAKITVTGTARMASTSLIPTQTISNVAELTFPVMVEDTDAGGHAERRAHGDRGGRHNDDHRDGQPSRYGW